MTEKEIERNSLNFRARSPKFGIEVDLDGSQPKSEKQNSLQKIKWPPKTKWSPNPSIFKLEAGHFPWKGHSGNIGTVKFWRGKIDMSTLEGSNCPY